MHAVASYGLAAALPFLGLLLTIAAAPLLFRHHWERHYWLFATGWSLAFLVPDIAAHGAAAAAAQLVAVAIEDYLPFVLLVGTLYVVTGGLRISGTLRGTPAVNTALLAFGTLIASVVGTPGASLILLRPLIRANRHRRQATHVIVFFIFLVGNVGGSLSPLGDPPLLLGYLRGVPFFWPTLHLAVPTLLIAAGLLATFYALDRYLRRRGGDAEPGAGAAVVRLRLSGRVNLLLLAAVIGTMLLRVFWTSDAAIDAAGTPWRIVDMVVDAVLLICGGLSLRLTRPETRQANDFAWAPIVEVAVLFAAIFVTLIPLLAMLALGRDGPLGPLLARVIVGGVPDNALFFRASGLLSAFLDNAPTYLVFFGIAGGDAARLAGPQAATLAAISMGACYFGGFTYIGNAPNLMVKAIAESHGIRMPGFFGYIGWAMICLLPWLLLAEALVLH
ncbi:MAG TPA: sodium:proton antiporter [Stellaceae bacterium]|nr:sodium:proton antiporter [Stellaceae bacterium]